MKVIVSMKVRVKHGGLPVFAEVLYKHACEPQKIQKESGDEESETFEIECIYSSGDRFQSLLDELNTRKEHITVLALRHVLEDGLRGGLLQVSGKMEIENPADYELKVQGAINVIVNKIADGAGQDYSGIYNSAGLLCAVKGRADLSVETIMERYAFIERDSVILNRFCGINGFPIMIQYQHIEDLIKTIKAVDASFSILRFTDIEDLVDLVVYEQVLSEMTLPVLSSGYDEIPLALLVETLNLTEKNGLSFANTNIGVIGITLSVLRLTRLFHRMGCPRVLGYDNNERLMLDFEKSGGMATTPENIFTNSDIILLFKNHFTIDEFNRIRSGQMMISLIDEEDYERTLIQEKGIKEYVPRGVIDPTVLFPGLVSGLRKSGKKNIPDAALVQLAHNIHMARSATAERPSLFGDTHVQISRWLVEA
jgi:hypothetical protein